MAKKAQKNYRIDAGVANKFSEICDSIGTDRNVIVEQLMKDFIAKDGKLLAGDIMAPWLAKSVEKAVEKQINRLAKMIYRTHVDATASVYGVPLLHKAIIKDVEDVLHTWINPQLLNPNRKRISDRRTLEDNGTGSVHNLRKHALTFHKKELSKKAHDDLMEVWGGSEVKEESKPEETAKDDIS